MAADTAAATRSPDRSKTTGGDDVQDEERDAKKMRTTLATEEDDDGDEDLEISSPLREPYLPDRLTDVDMRANPHMLAAYKLARDKFHDKQGHLSLPSSCSCTFYLRERNPSHLAADREEKLLPMRLLLRFGASPVLIPDSGRKAVLSAAGSIIRLSSSLGTYLCQASMHARAGAAKGRQPQNLAHT